MQSSFQEDWEAKIFWFNELLKKSVDSMTKNGQQRLCDAINYVAMAPGKRLRPLLSMLGAESICGDWRVGGQAAVAVELIHCYSLVHDDLPAMDDDDLRRGMPTCHVQFDEATAILTGDALQPMAFEALISAKAPASTIVEACRMLAVAAGPVALVGGQADDLQAEKTGGDAELLAKIHARKTGAMIRVSVELGGLLAGADRLQLNCLSEYGSHLGQAFQIVDDLLDVQGTDQEMGKRVGKDQVRGKLTYPGLHGVDASKQAAANHTNMAIDAVKMLGERSQPLTDLARMILERSR